MTHQPSSARPELVDGLVQLSFAVQAVLAQVASEHDLSVAQVRLLGVLRDRKPGMGDLATLFGVDKSSMTGLVDRAERRGLVERQAGEQDRRSVQVVIAEQGRALIDEVQTPVYHKVSSLLDALSSKDRAGLEALVTRLNGS